MKVASLVFLVAFLAFSVECGKANHNKNHHKNVKNEEGPDDGVGDAQGAGDWPNPGSVGDFDVPQSFIENIGPNNGEEQDESQSGKHHGKSSHKGRRH